MYIKVERTVYKVSDYDPLSLAARKVIRVYLCFFFFFARPHLRVPEKNPLAEKISEREEKYYFTRNEPLILSFLIILAYDGVASIKSLHFHPFFNCSKTNLHSTFFQTYSTTGAPDASARQTLIPNFWYSAQNSWIFGAKFWRFHRFFLGTLESFRILFLHDHYANGRSATYFVRKKQTSTNFDNNHLRDSTVRSATNRSCEEKEPVRFFSEFQINSALARLTLLIFKQAELHGTLRGLISAGCVFLQSQACSHIALRFARGGT